MPGYYYYYYKVDGERRYNFNCPCSNNLDSDIMMNTIIVPRNNIIFSDVFPVIEASINPLTQNPNPNCDSAYDMFSTMSDFSFIPSISSSPDTTTTYLTPTTLTRTLLQPSVVGSWGAVTRASDKPKHHLKDIKRKAVRRVHFED